MSAAGVLLLASAATSVFLLLLALNASGATQLSWFWLLSPYWIAFGFALFLMACFGLYRYWRSLSR